MHFHLPKPLHGWRALAGEVGIIVIGVLIALGAEQVVEAARWHEKVATAKKSIDYELNAQLDYSEEIVRFGSCTDPFVDALEAAIIDHHAKRIEALHDIQPPFEPRPWRSTAWQSAMSTQVADHFDPDDLNQYAFMFSGFDDMMRGQDSIVTDFAEATTGRLGASEDATSIQAQLSAAERLRTQLHLQKVIAHTLVLTADGARTETRWKFTERHRSSRIASGSQRKEALCERTVKSLR